MADTIRIEISVEAIDNTNRAVQEIVNNLNKIGSAAGTSQASMDKATQSVSKFDKQAEKTTKTLQGWMRQKWQLELEAVDKVSPVLSTLRTGLSSLTGRAWSFTMRALDLATAPIRGVLNLLRSPLFAAGSVLGISIGLKDTIDTYKTFEAAMSQVQAISGATAGELGKLTAKAKEMGATTKFTAAESAEAFNYMAMAGWKTQDMLSGISGILNLAAASGEDLATTSDIVTDALTAFNMEASDASRFSDVLAAASSNANTNVAMMGETFKYVGAMAGTLGYSIEDTALAIGLMANAGIKSSQAGTELNAIFTRLSVNTNNARDAIEDLGIKFYDDTESARPFIEILSEMREKTQAMTDAQKTSFANTVAGQRAQAGLLAMLNASEKDYLKLADAVKFADGAAERMAETMLDNVQGSMTLLQSAVDGAKISLGERLAPYLRRFADGITARMPQIQRGIESFMDWFDGKVTIFKDRWNEAVSTDGFEEASLFGKVHILWDKIIGEPFQEWWSTTGKAKLAGVTSDIGTGIGTGLRTGMLALLGVDISETADEGVSIGRSFAEGFAAGLDFEKVGAAIKKGIGAMLSDVGKFLPGGEAPGLDSLISGYMLSRIAAPALAVGRVGLNVGRAAFTPTASGAPGLGTTLLGSAAAGTGLLGLGSNTAIALGAGNLAGGASLSVGALSALGLSSIAGGAVGAGAGISGIVDIVKASKAEDDREKAAMQGAGAQKIGGAAGGAALGALIGSIVPVIGTAAGALIGAGIGGVAGIASANRTKRNYEEQKAAAEAAAEAEAQAQELIRNKAELTGLSIRKITFNSRELDDAFHSNEVSAEDFGRAFRQAVAERTTQAFGNITLTLQEIKDLASSIVFDGMAGGAEQFAGQMQTASRALDNVKEDVSGLEKLNWQASLGFNFSDSDIDSYKQQIDGFVKDAKAYITSRHYEATLALRLITGRTDGTEGLDTAYAAIQAELESKSAELTEAVQRALEDGVLSTEPVTLPDGTLRLSEYDEITGLQDQINEIIEKVSDAQTNAQMEKLQIKYGGSNLSAESFTQLQSELAASVASMTENYDQALEVSLTNLHLQLAEGAIDDAAFAEQFAALKESYQQQLDDMNLRVETFQLDTIAQAFSEELEGILPGLEGEITDKMKQVLDAALAVEPDPANWTQAQVSQWFGLEGLDAETQVALFGMLQSVAQTVPESVVKSLEEQKDTLQSALSGNLADTIRTTDLSPLYESTDWMYKQFSDDLITTFGQEINVTVPVRATYAFDGNFAGTGLAAASSAATTLQQVLSNPTLDQRPSYMRANGGFTNGPELSWVGEDGPEAIIPLGAKRRGRGLELYEQVGEILGVAKNANGGIYAGAGSASLAAYFRPAEAFNSGEGSFTAETRFAAGANAEEAFEPIFAQSDDNSRREDAGQTFNLGSTPVKVEVTLQPEFRIEGAGDKSEDDIVNIIRRHIKDMADEMGGEIAERLVGVFENMPLKGA